MYIVLLGAPGSGKGTIGKILAEDLQLAHISTGDLFRENLKNETELGLEAKKYMDKGELVPDTVTINMLKERLKREDVVNGAILDGFPRTSNQAVSLDEMLKENGNKVDMALNLEVPFEDILVRIVNRQSCTGCSAVYNTVLSPSKKENICDECGSKLYQRDDQKPEIVENRLKVYKETADELINHYEKAGVLYTVQNGNNSGKTPNDLAKEVEETIKK